MAHVDVSGGRAFGLYDLGRLLVGLAAPSLEPGAKTGREERGERELSAKPVTRRERCVFLERAKGIEPSYAAWEGPGKR